MMSKDVENQISNDGLRYKSKQGGSPFGCEPAVDFEKIYGHRLRLTSSY
jgi:hypothetical protein